MPAQRFRLAAAVYGVLTRGDSVLLMRRTGSGYRDGQLGLPAGHLDGGEDAVTGLLRELSEELAVTAERDSCQLAVGLHRAPESPADVEYLDLVFAVGRWTGTPRVAEPDKCSELVWSPRRALPADVIDYVAAALSALSDSQSLGLYGWPG